MKNTKFILLLFVLCSCTTQKDSTQNSLHSLKLFEEKGTVYENDPYTTGDDMSNIEQFQKENMSIEKREQMLLKQLKDVKNIKSSVVNIIGDRAIVIIEIEGELDDNILKQTKAQVKEIVMANDKQIDFVAVNVDTSFMTID